MSENAIYDLVIIGSGPAGITAAIYGQRAMMNQVLIEKEPFGGGQIITTDRVDNYPGLYGVSGYDLAQNFQQHMKELEIPTRTGTVRSIINHGQNKTVELEDGSRLEAKAILIATGARHKKLDVPGEERLTGAGVSYCATCDGAFFKGRTTMVIGGGDVALEEALYLSNLCEKVYLVHRRDEFRATKVLQDRVGVTKNIEFMPFYEVKEIHGKFFVEEVSLIQNQKNEEERLKVDGVFVAIGMEPMTSRFENIVQMDGSGYIVAGEDCRTNVKGIYVAGDVRTKNLRQVVTAVADGAVAIQSVEQDYL